MKSGLASLAFDLGSSNGRIFSGVFNGETLKATELIRFPNYPVEMGGIHYWDLMQIWKQVKQGLVKAAQEGSAASIATDSWGADVVLLGKDGQILSNLISYRDDSVFEPLAHVNSLFTPAELFPRVGSHYFSSPTIPALTKLKEDYPGILDHACTMLNLSDFFNYLLSGEKYSEYTICSTTQLLNPANRQWHWEVIDKLGYPAKIFLPPVLSGKILGEAAPAIQDETSLKKLKVTAACGHDSASAMLAVPAAEKEPWLCISSGSWSVLMYESGKPCLQNKDAFYGLLHEGCYGGTTRLTYNLIGLWIIQQLRREFGNPQYDELDKEAAQVPAFRSIIAPQQYRNLSNVVSTMQDYCKKTGQYVPETKGELARSVYDSLALNSVIIINKMQNMLGFAFEKIYIVGGGCHSSLMIQSIADLTGKEVIAGPEEAAVIGNILTQLIALGEIGSVGQAREVVKQSCNFKHYSPQKMPALDMEKYTRELYDMTEAVLPQ
ncbi:rhamnulokinase [Spirochaetia bacterium]|nr:rhamnulokinase [Spirochaetia bacterium]